MVENSPFFDVKRGAHHAEKITKANKSAQSIALVGTACYAARAAFSGAT